MRKLLETVEISHKNQLLSSTYLEEGILGDAWDDIKGAVNTIANTAIKTGKIIFRLAQAFLTIIYWCWNNPIKTIVGAAAASVPNTAESIYNVLTQFAHAAVSATGAVAEIIRNMATVLTSGISLDSLNHMYTAFKSVENITVTTPSGGWLLDSVTKILTGNPTWSSFIHLFIDLAIPVTIFVLIIQVVIGTKNVVTDVWKVLNDNKGQLAKTKSKLSLEINSQQAPQEPQQLQSPPKQIGKSPLREYDRVEEMRALLNQIKTI
jgi:hypothetical protein